MAFLAMGVFDKMKNMTEKLSIKDVSKKVINYVVRNQIFRHHRLMKDRPFNKIIHPIGIAPKL